MSAPNNELRYAFLDIGVGDCTVITWDDAPQEAPTPDPRCIVVDGGKTKGASNILAKYLVDQEVKKIDLLVITHIDWDHLGGIIQLFKQTSTEGQVPKGIFAKLANIRVGDYWGPLPKRPGSVGSSSFHTISYNSTSAYDAVVASVKQNQDLLTTMEGRVDRYWFPSTEELPDLDLFNNLALDFLGPAEQRFSDEYSEFHPSSLETLSIAKPIETLTIKELNDALEEWAEERAEQADTSANNQSVVISITPNGRFAHHHKDKRLLLTGDAEKDLWEHINELANKEQRLSAEYFKVPHHGAASGMGRGWDLIGPTISVLSVGPASFGHPHLKCLKKLPLIGSQIYCTERNPKPLKKGKSGSFGYGGGDGYCLKIKEQCPKAGTSGKGCLKVTLAADKKQPIIEKAGERFCPVSWPDIQSPK